MKNSIQSRYELWKKQAVADRDLIDELEEIAVDENKINSAFYRNLEFGTGGLRGRIGAGTTRINYYTIAKATQGVANFILEKYKTEQKRVVIGYDSRYKSKLFAETAARVLAANNINVYLFDTVIPTPCLAYSISDLSCIMGIVITASHNPAYDNGYKVYDENGCQIIPEIARQITEQIETIDMFNGYKIIDLDTAVNEKRIKYLGHDILEGFYNRIENRINKLENPEVVKNFSIVYTPLNGTGLEHVLRVLNDYKFNNIVVVEEQKNPDSEFQTCQIPNPENQDAMDLSLKYAQKNNADLILATDPDCDRIAIAEKNDNQYTTFTTNETGVLLLDYICSRYKEMDLFPKNPVFIKTIVTSALTEKIAQFYNVKTINVLTGFKYIGNEVRKLEADRMSDSFIFGLEESCGFLFGDYLRDKDAIGTALLICEMYGYYQYNRISLSERLQYLYQKFGFFLDSQLNYRFEGTEGHDKIIDLMNYFRSQNMEKIGQYTIYQKIDYLEGIEDLPKSNVIKLILDNHCTLILRPSGTEPKLKAYLSVSGSSLKEAEERKNTLEKEIDKIINE